VPLLTDPVRLKTMAVATGSLGHRDAADTLARAVLDLAGGHD